MIVKGASRRSISFWSRHLLDRKENTTAEIKEIRGLAAENLRDALLEMEEDAKQTRCKNFFYQCIFAPAPGVRLSEEQWDRAVLILEKHRGIPEGQSRVIVEHLKNGDYHRHVVWSRIDLENLRAWPDRLDAKIAHAASREMREEFGLEQIISPFDKDRDGPRPERGPKDWEMLRGMKSGLDPREIKAEVTRIFRESEHAADFVSGLREHGYELVQGDRRDFCIVDSAGEIHSLARRIEGVKAKELREYMKPLPRETFPTVTQTKAHYREGVLADRMADLNTVQMEIAYEEALYRAAVRKERDEKRFIEPPARHIREERLEADKRWPLSPPTPVPTEIPAKYHFLDAAHETARTRDQGLPKDLKGMSAILMKAYRNCKEGYLGTNIDGYNRLPTLRESIDRMGVGFARATGEEAERSQREADFAKAVGNYAPRYKEGEVVAVRAWDAIRRRQGEIVPPGQRVYRLDQTVAKDFVNKLGIDKQLQGIEPMKQIMKTRAEKTTRENSDRGRKIHLETAAKPRGTGRTMGQRGALDSFGIPRATKTLISGAINAFGAVNTLADLFGSIISPNFSPEQVRQGEEATDRRKADGEHAVDLERFTTSKRFEIQCAQDKDNEMGHRESERER